MSRNLRPKSDLRFLKPVQSKLPKKTEKKENLDNGDVQLTRSRIKDLENVVKELEGRLERSEEKNEERAREFQALEDEYCTVLTEMINTKKENDSLMAQLKMQQCANECVKLPLLVNEKCPADIVLETLNINGEASNLCNKKEPHELVPVSEEAFEGWDMLLKNCESYASMRSWYLAINLKEMKEYLKKCISKTFAKPFIQKISFEQGNSFNDSNILSCLIETVQEKFSEMKLDDKQSRKEIVAAFRRFRDANKKNQQK